MNKKEGKWGNAALTAVFLLYVATVLRITVFRSGFSFDHLLTEGRINTALFTEYGPMLHQGRWPLFVYLFFGNIIFARHIFNRCSRKDSEGERL